MKRRRESRGRGVSRCTSRDAAWRASWVACVCYCQLMLIMQLTTLPPATALLLSLYVSVCRGVRATHVCPCVFMHIRHVWLSCRSRTDEHRHLVECLVYPQGLQIQNSPDPGPRNNILNVTDCIKGEAHAVGRTRIRNNTGWEEKVNTLWKLRMSGWQTSFFSLRTASGFYSFLSHSFHPWSYGRLRHLYGDLLTQEILPGLPELLYTRILYTVMWRVEPVYSLIEGTRGDGGE